MLIQEKIQEDLKSAIKAKNSVMLNAIRGLKTAIKNREIQDKAVLNSEQSVSVVMSEIKKRREAIKLYEQGGRPDLAEAEKQEAEVLAAYLPEQLSEEDLKDIVKSAIEEAGALNMKDMGKVIGAVMQKVKGTATGDAVSRIVKEQLGLM